MIKIGKVTELHSGGGLKPVYLTHSRGGGVFSFSNLGKYTGLQCTKWVGVSRNSENSLSTPDFSVLNGWV